MGAAGRPRFGATRRRVLVSAARSWRTAGCGDGMKVTQRNVTLTLLSLLTASTSLLLISEYFTGIEKTQILGTGFGALISGLLLYVYWRWPAWAPTRYLVVITIS